MSSENRAICLSKRGPLWTPRLNFDNRKEDHLTIENRATAAVVGAVGSVGRRDVLGDGGNVARKIVRRRSYRGLYQVLEYEATLELEDQEGKSATFKKREKVRYLQDNTIAYQDQAWGGWRDPRRLPVLPRHAGGPIPVRLQDLHPHLTA